MLPLSRQDRLPRPLQLIRQPKHIFQKVVSLLKPLPLAHHLPPNRPERSPSRTESAPEENLLSTEIIRMLDGEHAEWPSVPTLCCDSTFPQPDFTIKHLADLTPLPLSRLLLRPPQTHHRTRRRPPPHRTPTILRPRTGPLPLHPRLHHPTPPLQPDPPESQRSLKSNPPNRPKPPESPESPEPLIPTQPRPSPAVWERGLCEERSELKSPG